MKTFMGIKLKKKLKWPTLNPKVAAMKNLQASCNEDANKFMEQAEQEKATKKHLNFFTDLATFTMITEDTMSMEEEPTTFYKAWNNPHPKSWIIGKMTHKKILVIWKSSMEEDVPQLEVHKIKLVFNIKHNGAYHTR